MSTRHFARAFIAETGSTPSKAVERLRIEVARQQVQSSSEAIERVAETTGFRDPERMRRAFIRAFGQPPQSLRRAARAGSEPRKRLLLGRLHFLCRQSDSPDYWCRSCSSIVKHFPCAVLLLPDHEIFADIYGVVGFGVRLETNHAEIRRHVAALGDLDVRRLEPK